MPFGFMHLNGADDRSSPSRPNGRHRTTRGRHPVPTFERLDPRQLLTVAVPAPDVTMITASTTDSQSVTITYDVKVASTSAVQLGFYRSTDPTFSTDDVPVEPVVALPSVDSANNSLGSVGVHTVKVPIPGGLPLNPSHPYVLAVANPTAASAADPSATASFRTYTIGVVTHGGIQIQSYKKNGVPWANGMAHSLLAQGYDKVISYNWVADSIHPGRAVRQGPKLAKQVLDLSNQFPSSAPVDVQFISHSEGAVVNTEAIVAAAANPTKQLAAGYWEDTLLDPHAANSDFTGRQYSTSGILGPIAKFEIDKYQSQAKDPIAFIPDRVNKSEVFYQQTPADHGHGTNDDIYNLWGQVPVKGDSVYYNLTPAGIVHSGKNSVFSWYQNFVVPTLGNGSTDLKAATLTATLATTTTTSAAVANTPVAPAYDSSQPTFTGKAQAGSPVSIQISHTNDNDLRTVARTTADANGNWTATVNESRVPAGRYRILAVSRIEGSFAGKRAITGVVPLGPLVINQTYK